MAQNSEQLERLARELAALDAADRARVLADANRLKKAKASRQKLKVPKLSGGNEWVGGDLRREDLYGNNGR